MPDEKKDEAKTGLDKIEEAANAGADVTPVVTPDTLIASELSQPPKRGPGRPRNTPEPVAAQPAPQIHFVQAPAPQVPDAIPDFDKTVPGGRYYDERGNLVNARGDKIKMGEPASRHDVERQAERDEQIDLFAQDHDR